MGVTVERVAPAFEPLADPLYFNAVYKPGMSVLEFFKPTPGVADWPGGVDLNISNVPFIKARMADGVHGDDPYYHLEMPQQFNIEAIAMRPIDRVRDLWATDQYRLEAYRSLRAHGSFRLSVGSKPYVSGPLDHILDLTGEPDRPISFANVLDIRATQITSGIDPVTYKECPVRRRKIPLHIASLVKFGVTVEWDWAHCEPVQATLPLRVYLIGTWFRAVC